MRKKPMDGWRIARLCGFLIAITIGFSLGRLPANSGHETKPADPGFDSQALDFADIETRQSLFDHERYLRHWNLDSLQCHQGRESYRVFNETGLMGGDMLIVEVQIDALNASIDIRKFGRLAVAEGKRTHGWIPVSSGQLSRDRILEVHDQLTDILRAGAAPRSNDFYPDVPRVTVETCRLQRYHFFDRAVNSRSNDDGGAAIIRLARTILNLARQVGKDVWLP